MSRGLTTATKNALIASSVRPVFFIKAVFSSETLYLWSGLSTILWNSQTWTGLGYLIGISEIEETADVSATGIKISLSGIQVSDISRALTASRQGKEVTVYLGAMDDTGAIIVDPYTAFSGRMDVPDIDEGAETSTIGITVESRLIDGRRSGERRYTSEDQKAEYSGDLGFDYVPSLQEWNGVWGQGSNQTPSGSRGGVGSITSGPVGLGVGGIAPPPTDFPDWEGFMKRPK